MAKLPKCMPISACNTLIASVTTKCAPKLQSQPTKKAETATRILNTGKCPDLLPVDAAAFACSDAADAASSDAADAACSDAAVPVSPNIFLFLKTITSSTVEPFSPPRVTL